MDNKILQQLKSIFKNYPEIKLVYLFGSRATDKNGPMSDYDFAFYLDKKNKEKMSDFKLVLMAKLGRLLKTDKIDIVILNIAESPELKFNIIKEGKLIFEQEPFKVLIEPKILNEYFDFHSLLLRYNLTKSL